MTGMLKRIEGFSRSKEGQQVMQAIQARQAGASLFTAAAPAPAARFAPPKPQTPTLG